MFKVCRERCDECLFSPDKIVSQNRKNGIIRDCLANDQFFVCHKHSVEDSEGGPTGEQVCCRGWFDSYGMETNIIRIASRLHAIEEVDEPNA